MKINQHTKISALIKENSESIAAIVSIDKRFEKLNNPLLRKIFASRITIADAAKIGGTTLDVFFEKLKPLGFDFELGNPTKNSSKIKPPDFYLNIEQELIIELDVRHDIAEGKDPLTKIMETLKKLPEKSVLKLINSFEPTPLISLLSKKGYVSHVSHIDSSLVHTFIKREQGSGGNLFPEQTMFTTTNTEMERLLNSFGEKIVNMDVRELEMPLPMVTILNELETLPPNTLLNVLHRKIPIYLFPEVESRGYRYKVKQLDEGNVRILIYK